MCSPVLYDIGLEAAIGELASQTQEKFGIECRMIEGGQTRQIDEDLKGLLFKCTHELLKNVIKHARAEHIVVRMSYQDNIVFIAVDDDGFGFDARILANDSNKSTGVGLFGMRERLRMVGGEVDVRSDLCVGTSITISCPVQKK